MTTPAYDFYPAIDANLNFAPEVRVALAASPELRNQAVPMTTTARNNLTGAQLWNGRLIANTTTGRINRYDQPTATWKVLSEPEDLISLLETAGTPRSAVRPGDNGVLGTSSKAARADHVHNLVHTRFHKGSVTLPSESLGANTISTVRRTISVPGWENARVVHMYSTHGFISAEWFSPWNADSEIRYWLLAPTGEPSHFSATPTSANRPGINLVHEGTGMYRLYYDRATQTLEYYLRNGANVTATAGGQVFRWIAEV